MACGCSKKSNREFVWTSADGSETQTYPTEIQAKAKRTRKGGSYVPVVKS